MAPARKILIVAHRTLGDACANALQQAGFPAQIVGEEALDVSSEGGLLLYLLDHEPVEPHPFTLGIPVLVLVEPGFEDRLIRALALGAASHLVADEGGAFLRVLPALAGRLLDAESQRRRDQAEVDFLSSHDGLTGLGNRRLLVQSLERSLARAHRHRRRLALLQLDLDQFRLVNESHGHSAGDEVLRAVAERLRRSIRAADLICRLDGDEFAVLVEDVRSAEDADIVAQKLLDDMRLPLLWDGREIPVTASLGIAMYPEHGEDSEALLKAAGSALFGAKESGRSTYCVFSDELHDRQSETLTRERDLRLAVQDEQFEPSFQPQVDIDTGVVVGLESLLRWRHPTEGLLPPSFFLPALEESGLSQKVGLWLLERSIAHLVQWEEQFQLFGLRVSVNLSARQLEAPGLVADVRDVLGRSIVDPGSVELEITESVLLGDTQEAVRVLEELSGLGLRICIDDFGLGYSSMRSLRSLPVHSLKIAAPYVQALPGDARESAMVRGIAGLARGLDLTVIAEGVETEAQLDALRLHECDVVQGNLIAEPLSPRAVPDFLRTASEGLPSRDVS